MALALTPSHVHHLALSKKFSSDLSSAACSVPGFSEGCSAFSLINPRVQCSPKRGSLLSILLHIWGSEDYLRPQKKKKKSAQENESVWLVAYRFFVVRTNKWICP